MMLVQHQNKNLTIFESGLYRTTTTFLHTPKFNLLVDPNWLPLEIQTLKEQVEAQGDLPLILLFTHSDYDHIIGYRAFDAEIVIASKAFVENPDREKILRQVRAFDDANYILRDYPIEYPEVDLEVVKDGQQVQLGHCNFTFYLAPGHTADGIFTVVEPYGYLIAGDYLCNVEFPFIYDSSQAYLKTMRKLEVILDQHDIQFMIPGHGDAASSEIEIRQRIDEAIQYVEALRESVWKDQKMEIKSWLERYDFPIGLRKAHQKNLKLVKKELKGEGK